MRAVYGDGPLEGVVYGAAPDVGLVGGITMHVEVDGIWGHGGVGGVGGREGVSWD